MIRGVLSILVVSFLALPALAEDHDGSKSEPAQQSEGNRPEQVATALKPREANLLSAVFQIQVPVINDMFGESIPKAITKALEGDETDISNILADLMGTLNENQLETLIATTTEERDQENAKQNRDNRYVALMDRMIWAAKLLDGSEVKNEKSEKYNETFKTAFEKRREKSELIYEKMKQAMEGNKEAKEFLRKTLNRKSVLAFIDAQRKSGNTELANNLVDALSWSDGKEKFLDVFAGNESQRLKLGVSRDSLEKSIQAYSDLRGGLHTSSLASSKHATPRREFRLSGDNNGRLAVSENRPAAQPARTARRDGQTGSARPEAPPQRQASSSQPQRQQNQNSGSGSGEPIGPLKTFVTGKCNSCHTSPALEVTGTTLGNARIKKGGKTITLAQALQAVRTNSAMSSVPASTKSEMAAFAAKQ